MYQFHFTICMEKGEEEGSPIISYYHEHTGRCLYTRQKEHFAGLSTKKEDNSL